MTRVKTKREKLKEVQKNYRRETVSLILKMTYSVTGDKFKCSFISTDAFNV